MTYTSSEALIATAMLTAVAASSYGDPALPFAMPDVPFDPTATPNYIAVDFRLNKPGLQSLNVGAKGMVQKLGLLQLTVVVLKGGGLPKPLEIVGDIMADWPRGRSIAAFANLKVSIYRTATVTGPMDDPTRTMYPVIIPWQALDRA